MILEGLLSIQTEDGGVHTAAMGPEVSDTRLMNQLILKPFQSSRTSDLLSALPEGVFHLTDNVLLFAQAVTGTLNQDLRIRSADTVRGWILEDACEAFEFRIEIEETFVIRISILCRRASLRLACSPHLILHLLFQKKN